MTIDELLTELDNWPDRSTPDYDSALVAASRLMKLAAARIRELEATLDDQMGTLDRTQDTILEWCKREQ